MDFYIWVDINGGSGVRSYGSRRRFPSHGGVGAVSQGLQTSKKKLNFVAKIFKTMKN